MNLSGMMDKKVAGIPVVYIAGLFVAILVVIAWRMKTAKDTPPPEDAAATDTADVSGDPASPGGAPTFVANPPPAYISPDANQGPASIDSNDMWARRSIEWLAANGHGSIDQATVAIQKYLAGEHLSVNEGKLRDMAISHFGLPPELPTSGGTDEGSDPIPPVVTPIPAPTEHTSVPPTTYVVTASVNTWTKIAQKFYGNADNVHIDYLQSWNVRSGAPHSGAIPVGTRIWVPVYHSPKYIKATTTMRTATDIIKKNPPLNSVAMLQELNDGMHFPVANGTRVRVL